MSKWISAQEAAKTLGVSRATLYAYVSRGLVRSTKATAGTRERRYAAEDVERLKARAEERRDPRKVAERALHWGVPVLESAITLIDNGRLYYRGRDVGELARDCTVEQVASLIWTGADDTDFSATPLHVVSGGSAEGLPFINRAQSMLPLVAARDPLAYDLRPRAVANTGWRILNLLASVAAASSDLEPTIEGTLQKRWLPRMPQAAALLRAALITCADHELNVSAFTARCVASAGSNPYSVVVAGLAAIEGSKHGGMSARVETMLDELRRARDMRKAIADRLRRGEPLYGFGHPLYPTGDPRARLIFEVVAERFPKSPELKLAFAMASAAETITGEKPTIDFALVTLTRVLKLDAGAALTLFAIGRTIGWIGHAIEQYAIDGIIRPRARYVGQMPA
ncbi:MAG TPA: citrate synthase family protein [Thermoanaerobaculia bacterium]|nr:citrate synthase family protein [Thermoanaerobaculia bacterium]